MSISPHAPLLPQLLADAVGKLRRRYTRAVLTEANLVECSRFLDWLFYYPAESCGWAFETIELCRIPLVYLAEPKLPSVCHLPLGQATAPGGLVRQVYALPDWSLEISYHKRAEQPRGARPAVFPRPWRAPGLRQADLPGLALRESA